jgi:beta-glucosidase
MSDWIDGVAAVLEVMDRPARPAGRQCADLLFGVVNPSGKLAESFPCGWSTPGRTRLPWGERPGPLWRRALHRLSFHFDARQEEVLFPFGHGLSYTTFAYSHPGRLGHPFP